MSPARRATLVHCAVIAAVAVGYLLVRIILAPVIGPIRAHATDVLAGLALPSLFALALPATSELGHWARTLAGKLALIGSAAFVWEVAVPLVDARATPDPLDVLAYLVGTLVQHLLVRAVLPGTARA